MLLVLTLLVTSVVSERANKWHTEKDISNVPDDDLTHDCKTILPIDHKNFKANPILKSLNKIKSGYVKYNHAYGIPVLGEAHFTDDSMKRACYLLRYLFAGNEWLRRYAKLTKMYLSGKYGGWCCPPQMGNQGLSCSCNFTFERNKTNNYPGVGKGAPAHEMAHWFIKRMLVTMAKDGRLKVPKFQNDTYWSYQHTKYYPGDKLSDYLLNSYHQDKARGSTKIKNEKLHHYFIYTGQENFILNNGGLQGKIAERQGLMERNKNLYAILKQVWQCDNNYITVCKDAAYGFTKGLAQNLTIGKADPNNPQQMICETNLDKGEVDSADPISYPTDDVFQNGYESQGLEKCYKFIKKGGYGNPSSLQKGIVEQNLGNDKDDEGVENAWFLRRCCAKTAKFSFV